MGDLARLAREYGLEPEDLLGGPEPTAAHLSEADEAFLTAVTNRSGHRAIVVDREVEAHLAAAGALGVEPTLADDDVPEPSAADEHWDQAARRIRSKTRELQRRARAAAVAEGRAARKPGA